MALKSVRTLAKQPALIDVPVVGWVAGFDAERGLLVDYQGNTQDPLPARWTIPLDTATAKRAAAERQNAVLIFENGDPSSPIVVGLLQPDKLPPVAQPAGPPAEAVIDGRRVVLEGQDEVVLRCGPASITLRRNGAVIIKGAHFLSHSSGVNRIRGGAVQIN